MFRSLTTRRLVVDVSLGALFALVSLPVELAVTSNGSVVGGMPAVAVVVGVLIALVFGAALAVRRLAPGLALGAAWVGAVLQMALSRPPTISDLAIFGVLYTTAAYGSRLVYWLGLASAAVGAVVITGYLFLGLYIVGGLTLQTLPVAAAVLVAAAFALGLSWTIGALVRSGVRTRETRAAQLQAEAETVAEQERVRIARDMHDVVAHSLAVVIAQADGARYAVASRPEAATEALGTISQTARSALADVRLLLAQLRHAQADGPQPTLADLEGVYAQVRAAGVDLRVDVDPAPPGVPPAAVQLAVYRILQEALTNALRHGDGGPVSVHLGWHPDRVDLEVRNAMPAATDSAPAHGPGHGLIGMRERAQLVGGTLSAAAEEGAFVVTATVPVSAATP